MRYLITVVIAALSLNAFGQVPDYVPQDGLVAWYPFNGNANDASGNGNDLSASGHSFVMDQFGSPESAIAFTELSSQATATIPNSFTSSQEGSYSFWWRIDGEFGYNGYNLLTFPGETGTIADSFLAFTIDENWYWLGCENSTSGFTATARIGNDFHIRALDCATYSEMNSWNNTIVTLTPNSLKLYFNGVLIGEEDVTTEFGEDQEGILSLAAHNNPSQSSLTQRLLDNMGLWNRALTEEEILALYNAEPPISGCTDPTACNFDTESTSDDGSCVPSGCMDTYACNYNQEADCDDGSCDYTCCPGPGCCNEGTYWDEVTQTCIITNPTDTNLDGCTDLNDLMDILANYGDCAVVNYSLSFDGVDDYVEIPHISDYTLPSGEQTIQFDIKFSSFASSSVQADYVVWKIDESIGDGDLGMGFDCGVSNSAIHFRLWSGAYNTGVGVWINSSHVTLDEFEKVSFTVNDEELRAYLNGILVDSSNIPDGLVVGPGESPVWLSTPQGDVSGAGISFGGVLDNFEIWNSALTQQEIQSYMSTPPTGNEEGLVGYWDFNEGTGSTLTDQTSNGNDGVINGATWSTDVPAAP